MRVLFIEGDGDYDAMAFERHFENLEAIAEEVAVRGGKVYYEDAGGEFEVTVSVLEFGDVDSAFIDFMLDNFVDYDTTKARNFHILREEETE